MPDPKTHNADLAHYRDAVRDVAAKRSYLFIDLFEKLGTDPRERLTDNGIHLTEFGGWRMAQVLSAELGLDTPAWHISIDGNDVSTAAGTKIDDVRIDKAGARFRLVEATLPAPILPRNRPTKSLGRKRIAC